MVCSQHNSPLRLSTAVACKRTWTGKLPDPGPKSACSNGPLFPRILLPLASLACALWCHRYLLLFVSLPLSSSPSATPPPCPSPSVDQEHQGRQEATQSSSLLQQRRMAASHLVVLALLCVGPRRRPRGHAAGPGNPAPAAEAPVPSAPTPEAPVSSLPAPSAEPGEGTVPGARAGAWGMNLQAPAPSKHQPWRRGGGVEALVLSRWLGGGKEGVLHIVARERGCLGEEEPLVLRQAQGADSRGGWATQVWRRSSAEPGQMSLEGVFRGTVAAFPRFQAKIFFRMLWRVILGGYHFPCPFYI
jgi:hypothetical protein